MLNKALIYIECRDNEINPITFELLGKILDLNPECKVMGVLIGEDTESYREELEAYEFETVYGFNTHFSTEVYAKVLIEVVKKTNPDLILIGASDLGKDIAGQVACSLETGLTADCTDLRIDDNGNVVQIRPAFGGDIIGEIITENHRPQMATVRNNVFNPIDKMDEHNTDFIFENAKYDTNILVLDEKLIIPDIDISNENRLLVVGNFIKKKDDLAIIEELAKKTNFTLCCSRRVVERGIMPQSRQIGLSGKLVSPEIMITLGVSGSVQFMAGVKKVKKLIAVNNDETARIFNYAHYPILSSAYEIIPELLQMINE